MIANSVKIHFWGKFSKACCKWIEDSSKIFWIYKCTPKSLIVIGGSVQTSSWWNTRIHRIREGRGDHKFEFDLVILVWGNSSFSMRGTHKEIAPKIPTLERYSRKKIPLLIHYIVSGNVIRIITFQKPIIMELTGLRKTRK